MSVIIMNVFYKLSSLKKRINNATFLIKPPTLSIKNPIADFVLFRLFSKNVLLLGIKAVKDDTIDQILYDLPQFLVPFDINVQNRLLVSNFIQMNLIIHKLVHIFVSITFLKIGLDDRSSRKSINDHVLSFFDMLDNEVEAINPNNPSIHQYV